MILKEVLAKFQSPGNEKMLAQNAKNGTEDNQFGVKLCDIRKLQKK